MLDLEYPKEDHRSVDELFLAALAEADDDTAWTAVPALQCKGTKEILLRAESLCESSCPRERRVGADVLGQLGVPNRSFPEECTNVLLRMLESESDAGVLQAILVALSHQGASCGIEPAARLASHSDAGVRHAVVLALSGHDDQLAIDTLIALTTDPDSDVRDWATFGLGSQTVADSPAIRNALAARLADADHDTRGEALVGLARRNDERAVTALKEELGSESVADFALEAAELAKAPELVARLRALRMRSDRQCALLERAITACSRTDETLAEQ